MHSGPKNARGRRGGAAYTITEECERLFCETLQSIFLGEGGLDSQDSLVMGTQNDSTKYGYAVGYETPDMVSSLTSSSGSDRGRLLSQWLEMWDYAGGALFRGFIAESSCERSMFMFFDYNVLGNDLKQGLMALLELCSLPEIDCAKLVVCIDRSIGEDASKPLLRDLGWVGFEPITLGEWAADPATVSERWMLMSMEA